MLSKKIRTSILTDETYYRMSQRAYNYDYLNWYVDQIKSDDDTGIDAVVLVQAVKKNGKWVKSKKPENVVETDIGKDPINDDIKADDLNIIFGNDPKKEVYYIDTLSAYQKQSKANQFRIHRDSCEQAEIELKAS